jgi:hypothetical protein
MPIIPIKTAENMIFRPVIEACSARPVPQLKIRQSAAFPHRAMGD